MLKYKLVILNTRRHTKYIYSMITRSIDMNIYSSNNCWNFKHDVVIKIDYTLKNWLLGYGMNPILNANLGQVTL